MMKGVFDYLRRPIVLAMVLVIVFVFAGAGAALAVTYTLDIYIGLGTPPTFWGASYLTASEVVEWLKVNNAGTEVSWTSSAKWFVENRQENVSQVGVSGYGYYGTFPPRPPWAYLLSQGFFIWPDGYELKQISIPHPEL